MLESVLSAKKKLLFIAVLGLILNSVLGLLLLFFRMVVTPVNSFTEGILLFFLGLLVFIFCKVLVLLSYQQVFCNPEPYKKLLIKALKLIQTQFARALLILFALFTFLIILTIIIFTVVMIFKVQYMNVIQFLYNGWTLTTVFILSLCVLLWVHLITLHWDSPQVFNNAPFFFVEREYIKSLLRRYAKKSWHYFYLSIVLIISAIFLVPSTFNYSFIFIMLFLYVQSLILVIDWFLYSTHKTLI